MYSDPQEVVLNIHNHEVVIKLYGLPLLSRAEISELVTIMKTYYNFFPELELKMDIVIHHVNLYMTMAILSGFINPFKDDDKLLLMNTTIPITSNDVHTFLKDVLYFFSKHLRSTIESMTDIESNLEYDDMTEVVAEIIQESKKYKNK